MSQCTGCDPDDGFVITSSDIVRISMKFVDVQAGDTPERSMRRCSLKR